MIRPMSRDDLPRLLSMRLEGGETEADLDKYHVALEQLFPRLFFDTPWKSEYVQSLVCQNETGDIEGSVGVCSRSMTINGQSVTAAVSSDMFVNPSARRKMIGVQLFRTFLNGPQDISIADVGNEQSRRIWQQCGGVVAPLFGLNWMRVFRPAGFLNAVVRTKRPLRFAASLASPFATLMDSAATKLQKHLRPSCPKQSSTEPLTIELFREHMPRLLAHMQVVPVYDAPASHWLWDRLDYICRDAGSSVQQLVRNSNGEIIGWYIYQIQPGMIARVSQIVATPKSATTVLGHLLAESFERGAVGIVGRVQPEFLQAYQDLNCQLRRRSTFTLLHSRNPELLAPFLNGRAFLSLLEGECCLDIWNNPQEAFAAMRPSLDDAAA